MSALKSLSYLSLPISAVILGVSFFNTPKENISSLVAQTNSPRFVLDHYFKKLEYEGNQTNETLSFKNSVDGLNPKIKGNYYVSWVEDDKWEEQLKSIKQSKYYSASKINSDGEITGEKLKSYCETKKDLQLTISESGKKYQYSSKSASTPADISEWKEAVLYCTTTMTNQDYFTKNSDLKNIFTIISKTSDLSSSNISQLIKNDETAHESSSMDWGKKYLQDKLKGKSVDGAREAVFEWCNMLKNKSATTRTWSNDKDNFKTYCLKQN